MFLRENSVRSKSNSTEDKFKIPRQDFSSHASSKRRLIKDAQSWTIDHTKEKILVQKRQSNSKMISEKSERVGVWQELMGDDIQMKVVKESDENDPKSCDVGDAVFVDFIGRRVDDRDHDGDEVFHEAKDWLVVIGDKDVTPALEMGIRFMKEGETAMVYGHSKFLYGPAQRSNNNESNPYTLPPNSNCVYEVTIKKLVNDDTEFSDPNFQLQIAKSKKSIGNDVYVNEWAGGFGKNKALLIYKKASENLTNLLAEEHHEQVVRDEADSVLIDCLNNTAAVLLKAKEYGKAKEAATQVLLRDPDNMKALLRAARAAIYDPAGTFEESEAAIKAAQQVDPKDPDLKRIRSELDKKKKEYKKKSQAMFSKIDQSIGSAANGNSANRPVKTFRTRSTWGEGQTAKEKAGKPPSTIPEPINEPPSPQDDKKIGIAKIESLMPLALQVFVPILACIAYFILMRSTSDAPGLISGR